MSIFTKERVGAVTLGPWARLRLWWPPPRPRALVRKLFSVAGAVVVTASVGAAILLGLAG